MSVWRALVGHKGVGQCAEVGYKETPFDLTLADIVARGTAEVPQRWDDLSEYAGLIWLLRRR